MKKTEQIIELLSIAEEFGVSLSDIREGYEIFSWCDEHQRRFEMAIEFAITASWGRDGDGKAGGANLRFCRECGSYSLSECAGTAEVEIIHCGC